jgi:2-C-methyl-D-erythritol 2,4-cyclodiphosphate synthase
MRIGMGHDFHRLVRGRGLVLGGVTIPFEKGLLGHSDADVLLHAVCDALLGAAGLGDIGVHFPDTDGRWKDVSSLTLLALTHEMIRGLGFRVGNLDATLFAEAPRISPHRRQMQENIARTLSMEVSRVNIKATTTEGMGIIGKGEGMAATCIALIE